MENSIRNGRENNAGKEQGKGWKKGRFFCGKAEKAGEKPFIILLYSI